MENINEIISKEQLYELYKDRLIDITGRNKAISFSLGKRNIDIVNLIETDINKFGFNENDCLKISRRDFTDLKVLNNHKYLEMNETEKCLFMDSINAEYTALIKRANKLETINNDIYRDRGKNILYIANYFVYGNLKINDRTMPLCAPIFLIPVELSITSTNSFSIKKSTDDIEINKALIIALSKHFKKKINIEDIEIKDFNESTIDNVLKFFSNIEEESFEIDNNLYNFPKDAKGRTAFLVKDKFKIINQKVLTCIEITNDVYNDYEKLNNNANKTIESVLREQTIPDITDEEYQRQYYSLNFKDRNITAITPLDSSQELAVYMAKTTDNLVIYGPPGTGKTETILNIISDNLARNKKILVVSEKKAAINVLYNRLKGLQQLALMVDSTSFKISDFKNAILDKLNKKAIKKDVDENLEALDNSVEYFEEIYNLLETKYKDVPLSDWFKFENKQLTDEEMALANKSKDIEFLKNLFSMNYKDFKNFVSNVSDEKLLNIYLTLTSDKFEYEVMEYLYKNNIPVLDILSNIYNLKLNLSEKIEILNNLEYLLNNLNQIENEDTNLEINEEKINKDIVETNDLIKSQEILIKDYIDRINKIKNNNNEIQESINLINEKYNKLYDEKKNYSNCYHNFITGLNELLLNSKNKQKTKKMIDEKSKEKQDYEKKYKELSKNILTKIKNKKELEDINHQINSLQCEINEETENLKIFKEKETQIKNAVDEKESILIEKLNFIKAIFEELITIIKKFSSEIIVENICFENSIQQINKYIENIMFVYIKKPLSLLAPENCKQIEIFNQKDLENIIVSLKNLIDKNNIEIDELIKKQEIENLKKSQLLKNLDKLVDDLNNKKEVNEKKFSSIDNLNLVNFKYLKNKTLLENINNIENIVKADIENIKKEIEDVKNEYPILSKILKDLNINFKDIDKLEKIATKFKNRKDDFRNLYITNDNIVKIFDYLTENNLIGKIDIYSFLFNVYIYLSTSEIDDIYGDNLFKTNIFDKYVKQYNEQENICLNNNIEKILCNFIESSRTYNESSKDSRIKYKTFTTELKKGRSTYKLRQFIQNYFSIIIENFPIFIATPDVVSKYVPLEKDIYDIVIFDEASQLVIEKSIPSIYRSKKIIVVGDDKQLQPTSFFKKESDWNDEVELYGNDIDPDEIELNGFSSIIEKSLLNVVQPKFNSVRLLYHYRSKYEELISFSNAVFYNNTLKLAPNIKRNSKNNCIERIKLTNGIYSEQQNIKEAEKTVELIKEILMNRKEEETLGVITFNEKQKELIEDMLAISAADDKIFGELYSKERKRKDGFEDKSFFVKNIENVQGDERDIIIFSIGYGKNEDGKLKTNFGPLNRAGGENRLNVAITRAKSKIYIITSFEPEELDVDNSKNEGAKIFKDYLLYTKYISNHSYEMAETILNSYNSNNTIIEECEFDSPLEEQIYTELTTLGYNVDTQIGAYGFRIDLGIYDEGTGKYIVGIECDGATYHSSPDARERDVLRQRFLEAHGWKIYRIWSTKWFKSKENVLRDFKEFLENIKEGED